MRQGADMPVIRHIDALLGTAWVWDDEDDDDLEPRTDVEADSGPEERITHSR